MVATEYQQPSPSSLARSAITTNTIFCAHGKAALNTADIRAMLM
jgi:hypothetical protein